MASHMRTELVSAALEMALGMRRPNEALILHSDRGSQYASEEYARRMHAAGITCSMSRKGNCWDNAVVESFFGTLKQELIHTRSWKTRDEARAAIHEYIEVFYNRIRLHSSLGYKSPAQYEAAVASAAA